MSELRAPDPTVTSLGVIADVDIELTDPPTVHHVTSPCETRWRTVRLDALYARWFAVPCRTCFPLAPPPGGLLTTGSGPAPDPYLSWQTVGDA